MPDETPPETTPETFTVEEHMEAIHAGATEPETTPFSAENDPLANPPEASPSTVPGPPVTLPVDVPGAADDSPNVRARMNTATERFQALHQLAYALRARFLTDAEVNRLQAVLPNDLMDLIHRVSLSSCPPGEPLRPVAEDDAMWVPPTRAEVIYNERQITNLQRQLDDAQTNVAQAVGKLERVHKRLNPMVGGDLDEDLTKLQHREERLATTLQRIVNEYSDRSDHDAAAEVVAMATEALK